MLFITFPKTGTDKILFVCKSKTWLHVLNKIAFASWDIGNDFQSLAIISNYQGINDDVVVIHQFSYLVHGEGRIIKNCTN